MKRRTLKSLLSILLLAALLSAPISALAASNNAIIYTVSVGKKKLTNVRDSDLETVIRQLKNGTRVLYWGSKKGEMLLTIDARGRMGYIWKKNLKRFGAMNKKQVYVTTGKTDIYKRSGSKYKRTGSIGEGRPLIVYGFKGKWAYARRLSGKGVYIHKDQLKRLK